MCMPSYNECVGPMRNKKCRSCSVEVVQGAERTGVQVSTRLKTGVRTSNLCVPDQSKITLNEETHSKTLS